MMEDNVMLLKLKEIKKKSVNDTKRYNNKNTNTYKELPEVW